MPKYKEGSIIQGCVSGIESYGVFVTLDDYYNGLIHISEISHDFVKDVNNYVKLGETINVKVLDVDDDLYQVKLSIKDIDYKINSKKKNLIVEIGSGFNILKDNLNNWISVKLDEIKSKKA